MANTQPDRLKDWQREDLDQCKGRAFARRTLADYPSLRSIGPVAWDKDQDDVGYHISKPFTGQEYDPKEFEVVEGGWDHEHCYVCNAHIKAGDEYWQSSEPWPLELCLACYELLSPEAESDSTSERGGYG